MFFPKKISSMGVINITPNSFTDGGQAFAPELFEQKVLKFSELVDCIDVGAESTAPKNSSITPAQEISRWSELALPALKKISQNRVILLSVDTYKIETIDFIANERMKNVKLIWNDVSGDLNGAIKWLKDWPQVGYVFSHNLAPSRELTSRHMDFVQTISMSEFRASLTSYFRNHLEMWKKSGLKNELFLDPCFGFSKTVEQNNELVKFFPILAREHENWLVGISKKSFLKKAPDIEQLHALILASWINEYPSSKLVIRLHDPMVFNTLEYYFQELLR